jgi:hypothetical protein
MISAFEGYENTYEPVYMRTLPHIQTSRNIKILRKSECTWTSGFSFHKLRFYKSLFQVSLYTFQCFTAVFALECIVKIIALQRDYFSQYWNLFDLVVVAVSFIDLLFEILATNKNFAFRVVRLVRCTMIYLLILSSLSRSNQLCRLQWN